MLLLVHLSVAMASLLFTTYTFVRPSKAKFRASYALVAGTVASGTLLVITTHSNLLSTCVTGLVYLSVVFSGLLAARHKLAHATTQR